MTTQKDIAEALGISVSLVSRALSGKASDIGASTKTVSQIRKKAAELGYVPSAAAQMLKGAPSRTIGVVVYDFSDPFLGTMIASLQHLCHENNYSMVLAGFENRRPQPSDTEILRKHAIEGLIVLGSGIETDWLKPFVEREIPITRVGAGPEQAHVVNIRHNEQHAMELLLAHLHERGHRHIAYVGAERIIYHWRMNSFMEAMKAFPDMETRPQWCMLCDADPERTGTEAVANLLKLDERPDAIITAGDYMAAGVLRALTDAHIDVPGDMAVTGYDDLPLASMLNPPLTSIHQPFKKMIQQAFLHICGQAPMATDNALFEVELVIRKSS